jgi:hypothetical protein
MKKAERGQILAFTLAIMTVVSFALAGTAAYLTYQSNQRGKTASMEREKVALHSASLDVYSALLGTDSYRTAPASMTLTVTFSDLKYKEYTPAGDGKVSVTYAASAYSYDLTGTFYRATSQVTVGSDLSFASLTYVRI